MNKKEIDGVKDLLDHKYDEFCQSHFIDTDPIQIPKQFNNKEDIEIAAFFAATLAWGNRKMIISSANKLINIMGNSPYDFVMSYSSAQKKEIEDFKYRTFNSVDLDFFLQSLKNIYTNHQGLENVFTKGYNVDKSIKSAISHFREVFISIDHEKRSEKHLANVDKQSAAKRLNMFLRWMVRSNSEGVDFGLWKNINTSDLIIPLDVHCARTARALNLLTRQQTDWKAAIELTNKLKDFDNNDPVKYDFALFGLGVFEKFR